MVFQHAVDSDSQYAGLVEISGSVIKTTTKAMLFHDGTREAWLPLSKIKYEEGRGGVVTVFMPRWLAKKGKYV